MYLEETNIYSTFFGGYRFVEMNICMKIIEEAITV